MKGIYPNTITTIPKCSSIEPLEILDLGTWRQTVWKGIYPKTILTTSEFRNPVFRVLRGPYERFLAIYKKYDFLT